MQYTSLFLASMLGLAPAINAQTRCNGNTTPDWDQCAAIYNALLEDTTKYATNNYPGCTGYSASNVDPNTLNCRVRYCPKSADAANTLGDLAATYNQIRVQCANDKAGGEVDRGDHILSVENNPDYKPSKRIMRRSRLSLLARQQDGDTGYTVVTKQTSVEGDGVQVTGRLPAGSQYTITQTDSQTTGISSTVEVGASFFEIFTASASISVSQDFTTSSSEGANINIDCTSGQSGQIYWYPLFTKYKGFYTPSNSNVDFSIPEDTPFSNGNYRVRCLD